MTTLGLTIVFAKDLPRMSAFYQDGLGLLPLTSQSSAGWAVFDAGGSRLALHAIPADIAAGIAIAEPPAAREDTPIKLAFHTDHLDEVCARLVAHGGQLLAARGQGTTARDVLDPEGNVLQVHAG